MQKRRLLSLFFAASLTLAAVSPAFAQKSAKPVRPLADDAQQAEQEFRQAMTDPRLAAENDRFNAQVNEEMFRLRQQLIRDSMNKMQQRTNGQQSNGDELRRVMDDIGAFLIFFALLSAVIWLVRTIIQNRRWNRIASIQTEMHTKLLEKMASSQELLAYMDTEAGKRFLESSPFEVEAKSSPVFPYGRVLLSAQAGIVILFAGASMIWLQNRLTESTEALLVFGTLGMAVGAGLLISAGAAYSMSKHFGLTPSSPRDSQ